MPTILCFGDSNTWGCEPGTGQRYPPDVRWPGVLRRELGDGYEIMEEGLGGRTTVFDDPISEFRNGKALLIPILETHQPLDLVIIMLGTNDVQTRFGASALEIGYGMELLAGMAKPYAPVLLLAPPPLGQIPDEEAEAYEGAAEKSRLFARHFRHAAEMTGSAFFDTSAVIVSSDRDGIHLEATEHAKLGQAVAGLVRKMIGSPAAERAGAFRP